MENQVQLFDCLSAEEGSHDSSSNNPVIELIEFGNIGIFVKMLANFKNLCYGG